ncbi:MAG: ABC transporter permease [Betaproteobacteria bacterium]|nr:ABC transporter permease [Betaproteobacteria bacterium]
MSAWFNQHLTALRDALRRLTATPLNSTLSLFVIGIALTLPAAGWQLIDNVQRAASSASGVQQISLFMALNAERKDIAEIESRLKLAAAGRWRFISREEALKRLQGTAGMADLISSLPKNPLPDAFVIDPVDTSPEAMAQMAKTMGAWPKVAHVQLDAAWVKRFDALLRIARLAVSLLAAVFAAALVVVTFNTIRLQILAHAAEIEVARLIGATDAWIRRPFAYFGAIQGLLGGVLAILLVVIGSRLLTSPVAELAELYGANFTLEGPSVSLAAALLAAGAGLGWLGALLSVNLSLKHPD